MATVRMDDTALRARIMAALQTAGTKGGAGFQGHLQQKLNVSARVGTSASRAARLRTARARGRRAARFLYQASAPGEPPRKRTGTLQKSVTFEVEVTPVQMTVRAGSNVPYAPMLEFGTVKMAARPWLRPGLAEYQATFAKVVVTELRRQLATAT